MEKRAKSVSEAARELTEDERGLLNLLGEGLSVSAAARRMHLSMRTAERRLAEARAALGVATNAEALRRVGEGFAKAERDRALTAREREVLELVGHGLRNDDIAARLGIAASTVAALLRTAMAKLGARTRVQAAARLAGTDDED